MAIKSLDSAKKNKNDECYTLFEDIQRELNHYEKHFNGKIVYCNCDDPAESAFSDFFKLNFDYLGLKKLICTRYAKSELLWDIDGQDPVRKYGYKLEITGRDKCEKKEIEGDGDFRSLESTTLLEEADIICTNPPFSLFREYVEQLMNHKKEFLIIGPIMARTYKEVFPLIMTDKMWSGYTQPKKFREPDGKIKQLGNVQWWTNLETEKRHEGIEDLDRVKYIPDKFKKIDNYDAINIDNISDIPGDYDGVMGVPITFLDKYSPEQFEIIGITKTPIGSHLRTKLYDKQEQISKDGKRSMVTKLNDGPAIEADNPPEDKTYYIVNGKYYIAPFARILIKRRRK